MMRMDRYGRASFAVLALAILLLANLSVVYVMVVQRENTELANQANEIRVMGNLSSLVNDQVETAAHYIAMGAIRNSSSGPHNQTEINQQFSDAFSAFLDSSFPRQIRGYTVSVDDYKAIIITESKIVEDIVATGTVVSNESSDSLDAIKTGIPGRPEPNERVAYYRLLGSINYTISGEDAVLHVCDEISSEIESPFPFIHQQLGRMSISSVGAASDTEEILRYILTTVAQQRVLLGYAGGLYGKPNTSTYDIITAEDVEMAINIALIMEQLKHFRNVDNDAVRQFDTAYYMDYAGGMGSPVLVPSKANRTLERLIWNYAGNGTLDPADIFELFTATDRDTLRMNIIMAQALYAMIDQYTLKYLDYLNFLPLEFLADLGVKIVEMLTNAWDAFVEWLTGNSKEADMVREFIRDMFRDLGYTPTVRGIVTQGITAQTFTVSNADGTIRNISTPAGTIPIPLFPKDITQGHNDLWKSYYRDIFKDDLNRLHSGVRDLAKDVAKNLANNLEMTGLFEPVELNGQIDPRDNESILEHTKQHMVASISLALKDMRTEPEFYSRLVTNLWEAQKATVRKLVDCIERNYDLFADPSASVSLARDFISAWLMESAKNDPDYATLDIFALVGLRVLVLQRIDANGWAQSAYDTARFNDMTRFESLYQKAVDLRTPPEDGGLYRRMIESISGSIGILALSGDFIRRFMEGLMTNEDLSDNKVLVPAYTKPFTFRDTADSIVGDSVRVREETLVVDQTPDLLTISRLTRVAGNPWTMLESPKEGELLVNILDPSQVPTTKDSPNVHYTQVDKVNERPFETQWTIAIRGLLRMKVSTAHAIYLDGSGMVPVVDEMLIPLSVVIPVKVFSGWQLDGVAYASSNTLGGDIWNAILNFLDWIWDSVCSAFSWILDAAKFIIHQLKNLRDFLVSQASKILRVIQMAVDKVVHLIQEALKGAITRLLEAIDWFLSKLPSFEFDLSFLGLSLHIGVNRDPAHRLRIKASAGPLSIYVRFVNLIAGGYGTAQSWAKWDVLTDMDLDVNFLKIHTEIDPVMLICGYIIEISGTLWERWKFNFVGPVIEQHYSVSKSFGFSLPVDAMEIEFGFELKFKEPPEGIDIAAILSQNLGEAFDECTELPLSWDGFRGCTEILVTRFVHEVLDEIKRELDKVIEVTVFARGGVSPAVIASAGLVLEISVEGEGIVPLFRWLAGNIRAIVQRMFHPGSSIHVESVPPGLAQDIFIYAGFYLAVGAPSMITNLFPDGWKPEVSLTFLVGANIAFASAILGADSGPWEIRFGAVFEGPTAVLGYYSGAPGMVTDIWVIQGNVTRI